MHLKFLQKIDISDHFEKDEETQFDFSILPEIEKIIFYRVNEIFLFAVVDLRKFHWNQLLESPKQALLEAPVNNFSLVGTFSRYNEELTVVGNIARREEFFLTLNRIIGLSLKDQAVSTIVNTFSI